MDPETAQMLRDKVEWEGGLDYTFRFYSQFPEIEDKQFRKLVEAYVAAAQALVDYCGLDEEPEEDEPCGHCMHSTHPKGDCSERVADAAGDMDYCPCQSGIGE